MTKYSADLQKEEAGAFSCYESNKTPVRSLPWLFIYVHLFPCSFRPFSFTSTPVRKSEPLPWGTAQPLPPWDRGALVQVQPNHGRAHMEEEAPVDSGRTRLGSWNGLFPRRRKDWWFVL